MRRVLSAAAPQQGVREGSGRPQRRGLALSRQGAPAGQLADGDQDPEGEGMAGLHDAVPQGVRERDDREDQGGAADREDGRGRVDRAGHRGRPGRSAGPEAGGRTSARCRGSPVRPSSEVTVLAAADQPWRSRAHARARTMRGSN